MRINYLLDPVIHRPDVVRSLLRVLPRDTGRFVVFEQQQIGQRRLRPLDLGRQHGLLANERVEELIRIRKEQGHAVQASERLIRAVKQSLCRCVYLERWIWRQTIRMEGPIFVGP